jgi:hypothetical protein
MKNQKDRKTCSTTVLHECGGRYFGLSESELALQEYIFEGADVGGITGRIRGLTDNEKRILVSVFGNELDYGKIRVHIGGVFTVLGYSRGVGNRICVITGDIEINGEVKDKTLIHEAAHVWQYNRIIGMVYAPRAVVQHAAAYITEMMPTNIKYNPYDYGYLEKKIPWDFWPPEAQAEWITNNRKLPDTQIIYPFGVNRGVDAVTLIFETNIRKPKLAKMLFGRQRRLNRQSAQ